MRRHVPIFVWLTLFAVVAYAQVGDLVPSQNNAVEGYVVSQLNGEPINGAFVTVRSGTRSITVETRRTDASGVFRVPAQGGAAALSIVATGWETKTLRVTPESSLRIAVRLNRERIVRGVLRDGSGRGLAGAQVRLQPLTPGGLRPVLHTRTRVDGSYAIRGGSESDSYALVLVTERCPWRRLRNGTGYSLSAVDRHRDIVIGCQ